MAAPNQIGSGDLFDSYFRRADLDGDGHISGAEAVAFFQASNLPKNVLAQVWAYADSKKAGYLGRAEFYNALKLVTVAQSRRDLTPDIVKAALYGPASAKIPAPQINLAATPSPQPRPVTPANQAGGTTSAPSQTAWMGGSNLSGNAVNNQQYAPPQQNQFVRPQQPTTPTGSVNNQPYAPPQQNQFVRPQQPTTPTGSSQPTPNYPIQSTAMGVTMPTSRPQNPPVSSDWLSGRTSGSTGQVNAHGSNQLIDQSPNQNVFNRAGPGSTSSLQPRPPVTPGQIGLMPLKPQESAITPKSQVSEIAPKTPVSSVPSTQPVKNDSNTLTASRNGFPSDSLFGDVFSATPSLPKQNSLGATSLASSSSVSTGTVVSSAGPLASGKQTPAVSVQSTLRQYPVGSQNQHGESLGKPTQQFTPSRTASISAGSHGGAGNSASNQLTQSQQLPWPKMTPADVQKYTKVFMQVDTDRDGKITGNQARNLFLSWRLPREVLMQVWDLSDQDNDSMLSLKEFCIALYLMERYREGRPLPPHFPSTVMPNDNLFSLPGQPVASSWGQSHGFQNQPQVSGASRPPSIPKGKPPRPMPVPHSDGAMHPTQQKRKVPVLEKHLVDQLSKEEQESLNSKFQEATAVDKKVEELEKEITEAKQKIEFCRVKMQELVLYKSKCDNRFNETTERVSADKREVESLAKKYEEKFKQSGDVASKLSLEEATFRDIQEKKMELYQAIVKYEEGNPDDQAFKERGERIQSGLEELIKDLNERCKQYGLRGKPTSLVELPFGWQAGIQEAAADWDEDWDKLEDEGFTFVKELTLDVPNVIAPPREKISVKRKEVDTPVKKESGISAPNSDSKETGEQIAERGTESEQLDAKSPKSPAGKNAEENKSQEDSHSVKNNDIDALSHSEDTKSDHDRDGNKFTHSSNYDIHFDTDSAVGFSDNGKDNEKHYSDLGLGFGFEEFSIKPIRTSSSDTGLKFPGKPSLFSDSVPSTPADMGNIFAGKQTFFDDSVPSTPANASDMFPGKKSFFDDSVPSTPAYAGIMFPEKKSAFDDSVPSTPAYGGSMFPDKKSAFDDSVPSTPAYGGSIAFPEKKSFFDDSVPSTPAYNFSDFGSKPFPEPSPFMFDSVPSTPAGKSSEDQSFNSFSRFDSFKSEADPFASRFDSFSSNRFDSFNSHSFDSSNQTQESGFGQSPRKSLARFDSIGSSKDSTFDYSHGFGFDDADPFKTSKESQTPRSSDHWNAF